MSGPEATYPCVPDPHGFLQDAGGLCGQVRQLSLDPKLPDAARGGEEGKGGGRRRRREEEEEEKKEEEEDANTPLLHIILSTSHHVPCDSTFLYLLFS